MRNEDHKNSDNEPSTLLLALEENGNRMRQNAYRLASRYELPVKVVEEKLLIRYLRLRRKKNNNIGPEAS